MINVSMFLGKQSFLLLHSVVLTTYHDFILKKIIIHIIIFFFKSREKYNF